MLINALVQNGIGTPVAAQQQQKLIENLLVEQVIRNPATHDKIGLFFGNRFPNLENLKLKYCRLVKAELGIG